MMAGGKSGNDELLWVGGIGLLVAVVMGGAWWRKSGEPRWRDLTGPAGALAPARVEAVLPFAIAGAVVLLCVAAGVGVWLRVREAERERHEQAVRAVIGERRAKDSKRLVRVKGRGITKRVVMSYPAGWVPSNLQKERLVKAVSGKAGRPMEGGWRDPRWGRRGQAIFVPAAEPVERERAGGHERVERVVAEVMGQVCNVRVAGWDHGVPVEIRVSYEPSGRAEAAAWRAAVERKLGALLPGGQRWAGDWRLHEDQVTFRPRPVLPDVVPHPGREAIRDGGYLRVGYGRAEDGSLQEWDLLKDPHCLVVGGTSNGKTSTGEAIIVGLSGSPLCPEFVCVDPKEFELARVAELPNVTRVATTADEMTALIAATHGEMKRRNAQLKARTVKITELRPLILVVEEFIELRAVLGTARGAKVHPALEQIWSIARLGRKARVHLLLMAQRPDADFLEGATRDNISHRISLGPLQSAQGAVMMWGNGSTGRDIPEVKGRATAKGLGGPREVQVFWVDLESPSEAVLSIRPDPGALPPSFLGDIETDQSERLPLRPGRELEPAPKRKRRPLLESLVDGANDGAVTTLIPAVSVETAVGRLHEGDRAAIDVDGAGHARTVTVVSCVADDDDDYVQVEWRDDAGSTGVVSLPAGELTILHPR